MRTLYLEAGLKLSELGPLSLKEGDREPPKVSGKKEAIAAVSQSETDTIGKENPEAMKAGRLVSLIAEAQKRLKTRKAKQGLDREKAFKAYQRVIDFESDESAIGMRLDVSS